MTVGIHKQLLVLFTLSLLCMTSAASAQILNVEKRRIEQDQASYVAGNLGLDLSYDNRSPSLEEPIRVLSTGLSSNVGYFLGGDAFMMINEYQLLLVNEGEVVNTGFTHLRTQFNRDHLLSYEVFAQFQYDRPRGMLSRWLLGAGPRVQIVRTAKAHSHAGVGAMFELENWRHPNLHTQRLQAMFLKAVGYISTRIEVNDIVDFNGVVYYQTAYDRQYGFMRHRISAELNLLVRMNDWLSLTSSFFASYENRPIVPIIPFVFSTTHGVRLNF